MQFKTKVRIAKVIYHAEAVFLIILLLACLVGLVWGFISMIPSNMIAPLLLLVGGVVLLSGIGMGLHKLSRWAHDVVEKVKEYDV